MSDFRPNIWRLQAQSDVDGLIGALDNSDPDIRQRAAIALRALSATSAIPALRAVLAREEHPAVRTNVTAALVFLLEEHQEQMDKGPAATPPDEVTLLVRQLQSKDTAQIIHAAQALGALGDQTAVEALIVLFNNPEQPANVRLAAAEALIELKSAPTMVTALVALRKADTHLRRVAAAMLGHLEADWAVEPLRAALKDEQELVRRTARAALKHIGTPEALKALDSVPEHEQEAIHPAAPSTETAAPAATTEKLIATAASGEGFRHEKPAAESSTPPMLAAAPFPFDDLALLPPPVDEKAIPPASLPADDDMPLAPVEVILSPTAADTPSHDGTSSNPQPTPESVSPTKV